MSSNFLGFGDREKRMCVSGIIHITIIIWLIFEKYQKGMETFIAHEQALFQKVQRCAEYESHAFKGPISGLRQVLTIESPLKMIKNTFYFTFKVLSVLEIFIFFSLFCG